MAYCECCQSEGVRVREYENGIPKRKANLCKLCANTMAGNAFFFSNSHSIDILGTVCFIGNEILKMLQAEVK